METVADFIFLGSKITADGDCSHEIKTHTPWKESYDQPRQHIKKQRHYFANKGLSVLFNMLSRLDIAFLLISGCLLISWLQKPSTVTLEPKKIKSVTVSIVSPSICHEVIGPDAMIFVI